jgi:hypothetical protein
MSSEAESNDLADLIASVLRDNRPMTSREIAKALRRRSVKTDSEMVTRILLTSRGRFGLHRPRFFQRRARWQLVEAGPADDPGHAGAPVSARPYRPILSGSAAIPLAFREDDPPTNAIGRAV